MGHPAGPNGSIGDSDHWAKAPSYFLRFFAALEGPLFHGSAHAVLHTQFGHGSAHTVLHTQFGDARYGVRTVSKGTDGTC